MKYTPAEVRLIRKYATSHTAAQIGEMLGRSRGSVKSKVFRMGLHMMKCGGTHFNVKHTDHDIELCRVLYDEGLTCSQIAEKMETSPSYVRKIVAHIVRKPA